MVYRSRQTTAASITGVFRNAGADQTGAVLDARTVAGPASYTTGGIPVDLSAVYPTLIDVMPGRIFATATLAHAVNVGRPNINQTGSDLFSAGKFRLSLLRASTQTFTGTALGTHVHTIDLANGDPTNIAVTAPNSNGSALAAGLTGGAGATTGHTGIQATSAGTPAGTNSITSNSTEITNGSTATSGNTLAFWVMAVPT